MNRLSGFHKITLGNVANGRAEQQFQRLLPKIVEAFRDPSVFECPNKQVTYTADVKISFTMMVENGTLFVNANVVGKPPRPRSFGTRATIEGDEIWVEKAVQQDFDFDGIDGGADPAERREGLSTEGE